MNRSTSDYVFWKMNPDTGRQRRMGGEKKMKGMRSRVICCWWNIKHYSWPCAWTDHEGSCLPAHLLTHYYIVLCTVNTVPHTLTLITVELICSQVLLTCICAELRDDCLGEETSFIRRLKNCYSITHKDITNTVMQLGRGCRMYLFIAVQ